MYDKERIVITQSPHASYGELVSCLLNCCIYSFVSVDEEEDPGFFVRMFQFFSSLLFKLGSLLYLAAAAILCLDVIVLHR